MSAPVVEDRAGRRRSGASANGNRLPAPVKERRPALAALAVLLIVGGALAGGLVVLRTGQKSAYLVVARTVEAGDRITARDLASTELAGGSGASGIAASSRNQIIGQFATTRVYAHTLASRAMFTKDPSVQEGYVVIGAVLTASQRPADPPSRGDVVRVYQVSKDTGTQPAQLVDAAQIVAVGEMSSGNGTNGLPVSLRVPMSAATSVASAAGQGELTVALLPPGTTPTPGTTATGTGTGTGTGDGTTANGTPTNGGTPTTNGATNGTGQR